MIVRGIDVGTQLSHFADVEIRDGHFRVVRFGEWRGDLPAADVVLIEFPSARWYGRANTATVLKVGRIAAVIALHESTKTRKVFLTDFDEWSGGRASRSELDAAFVRLISNGTVKGSRIVVDGRMTNEHERDAALIAVFGHVKYGGSEVDSDIRSAEPDEGADRRSDAERAVSGGSDDRPKRRRKRKGTYSRSG